MEKKKIDNNIIYAIFIGVVAILLILYGLMQNSGGESSSLSEGEIPEEYKDITYKIYLFDYCSCLTFGSNNKMYEYDCDSEPTNMPFSGETYGRYSYNANSKIITFKGKGVENVQAEVLSWDEDKLQIKVKGSKQMENCSSNNNNIYDYYVYEKKLNGRKMKEYLTKLNNDGKLIIEYWGTVGKQRCNQTNNERCRTAIKITTEDIYNEIQDDKSYIIDFFRDTDGKIESVIINYDVIE